jgi:hypothetical protein
LVVTIFRQVVKSNWGEHNWWLFLCNQKNGVWSIPRDHTGYTSINHTHNTHNLHIYYLIQQLSMSIPTRSICPKIIMGQVSSISFSWASTNQFGMSRASLNVNTTQQQPQSRRTQFTHINSITITNSNTILAPNYTTKRYRNPTTINLTTQLSKHTFGGPNLMGNLFLHTKQSTTPTRQSLTFSLANGCSRNLWNFHHPLNHWPIYVMHYFWKNKCVVEGIRFTLQKVNHHLLLGILPFKANLQKNYTYTHKQNKSGYLDSKINASL